MALASKTGLIASTLLLIAGCQLSTEPGDEHVSEVISASSGGVCAPLDYNHTTPNADYFRVFADDEEATVYAKQLDKDGFFSKNVAPEAKFKEISNDARLKKLVGEVFAGFQKIYPSETHGMTHPPRIVLVETNVKNAFAVGPLGEENKSPWLVFINTALLADKASDTQLRGLLAHELGHLILRTFLPEIKAAVRAIYLLPKTGENGVLGAAQDDDKQVAAHIEKVLEIQERTGGLPELGFPVLVQPNYVKVIDMMMAARTADTTTPVPAACGEVDAKKQALATVQVQLTPAIASQNMTPIPPTAEQRQQLAALSTDLTNAYRACLAGQSIHGASSLLQLNALIHDLPLDAANPTHADHAKLLGFMHAVESDVDEAAAAKSASLIDRLIDAEAAFRPQLDSLIHNPEIPIDRVRVFDYEEDADDASVRILKAIGDDPVGIGEFMLTFLTPETAQKCKEAVAAGQSIPFGRFIDSHPATCWRYYHATQFAKALSTCNAPPSQKSPTKGSGIPSVADSRGGYKP